MVSDADNPIRTVVCDDNLQLVEHETKRVGRPKNSWWIHTVQNFWDYLRKHIHQQYRTRDLDWSNANHINVLKATAFRLHQMEGGHISPNINLALYSNYTQVD